MPPTSRTWTRDGYLISTDPSLIPLSALSTAFASPDLYWAKPLPEEAMRTMITNSLCFGLYSATTAAPSNEPTSQTDQERAAETLHEIAGHVQSPTFHDGNKASGLRPAAPSRAASSQSANLIGFARLVTDYVTVAYLTDVYVLPDWQKQGLGKWMVGCVQQTIEEEMPLLRRSMAITSSEGAAGWYERMMKMTPLRGKGGEPLVISWRAPGSVF